MGYSQDTKLDIYHVYKKMFIEIYFTNREFVLLGNATSGGSGEGILVSWPRDPEDKDQEAQESNPEEPKSNQEQY